MKFKKKNSYRYFLSFYYRFRRIFSQLLWDVYRIDFLQKAKSRFKFLKSHFFFLSIHSHYTSRYLFKFFKKFSFLFILRKFFSFLFKKYNFFLNFLNLNAFKIIKITFLVYVFLSSQNFKLMSTIFNFKIKRTTLFFFFLYNNLFKFIYFQLFFFFKKRNKIKKKNNYMLSLNFRFNNKLIIVLRTLSKYVSKNFIFVTPGLFTKFFNKNKSLKKHKLFKLLAIKFFRKLLVILRLWKINLWVKNTPSMFFELMRFFNTSVFLNFDKKKSYLFLEDYQKKSKEEKIKTEHFAPFFVSFFFINIKSYVINKMKKKGRIKRKITRKLTLNNQIVD